VNVSLAFERLLAKVKNRGRKLAPILSAPQIESFERTNGVSLPPDYREFLLRVGNGGDGPPTYGLCPLGTKPSDFDFAAPDFSKPFPFTQSWIWEDGDVSAEGGKEDVYRGVLILGTDGCGQYWALIVCGPEFGRIWMLADVGITPVIPGMTFSEWYEAWLDGRKNWFG